MDTFLQDFHYAFRTLRKSPAFTLVAALTLAVGIGANTALFSVVNALLIRPLPFPEPERLVALYGTYPQQGVSDHPISYPTFRDWRQQSRTLERMAAYDYGPYSLMGDNEAEWIPGMAVSADFFNVLGLHPALGRDFAAEEDQPGRDGVAILSNELWRRRFAANPAVVGRSIVLSGRSRTVVGVMPPGFFYDSPQQLWVPLALTEATAPRGTRNLDAIARLAPGVTLAEARQEAEAIARGLAQAYPVQNLGRGATAIPLQDRFLGDGTRAAVLILVGAVGFVLLIAAANVANLVLARSLDRQREVALRTALGAGRGRIVRQLLVESVLLGALAGVAGTSLAVWGIALIRQVGADSLPTWARFNIDARVLSFAIVLAMLSAILAGLMPAIQIAGTAPQAVLKEGGRTLTSGRGRLRDGLVIAELSLSVVLLVGALLLIRTLAKLRDLDAGFNPHGVLALEFDLAGPAYEKNESRVAFLSNVIARVQALPGVRMVAANHLIPLDGSNSSGAFVIEGRPSVVGDDPRAEYRVITDGYFQTMQIPMLEGRDFTGQEMRDSASRVVVISRGVAQRYWPGKDAIGRRVRFGADSTAPWMTVVGIVGDVKQVRLPASPIDVQLYRPYGQQSRQNMALLIKTSGSPASQSVAIRREVQAVDRSVAIFNVTSMDDVMGRAIAGQRAAGVLLTGFAIMAMVLASIGLFGVMSYVVSRRSHEIGIRMALGAEPGNVKRLVVGQGMKLVSVGIAIGLLGALMTTRFLGTLLFDITPTDPATFAGIAVLLAAVALLACYLPARRAANVDPMVALRNE